MNNPVTVQGVDNAVSIYGENVKSIIEKTTTSKHDASESIPPPIPPTISEKHKRIVVCADTFYVNDVPFIITTSDLQ